MSNTALYALPSFSLRFLPIWRRNFLVWKKLAVATDTAKFLYDQVAKIRAAADTWQPPLDP